MEYLKGLYLFVDTFCRTAPIGYWTFIVAAILPAVMIPWLRQNLPASFYPHSRDFIVESVALVCSIALSFGLWPEFRGFVTGVVAGFMSPYLTKGVQAIGGVVWRMLLKKFGTYSEEHQP